jgi:ribonuclease BN (tRNA processing enzyme)
MLKVFAFLAFALLLNGSEVRVQVLGSGGPELSKRASSGYIVWIDGKSKLLIDCGGGTFLRFTQSGARLEDLNAILLTHNHIDHTADLTAFMKAGFFTQRTEALHIYGASGSQIFPATDIFLKRLLGENGAYAYMSDMLTPQSSSFEILPHVLSRKSTTTLLGDYQVQSIGVHHGIVPALAYRINVGDKSIVFTGDTNNKDKSLENFAHNADILIADFAIPEAADEMAKNLHIQPSAIARLASESKTKHLVLSHIMKRSESKIDESIAIIEKLYQGEITVAQDLIILKP